MFAFLAAAVPVPVISAGVLGTVGVLVVGIGGVVVTVAALYWFLSSRGVLRWISLAIAILSPIVVLVMFVRAHLLAEVVASIVLALLAVLCARAALRGRTSDTALREVPAPPARHPVLIMNPHSGGGKVAQFDLQRKELGAEVVLLEGPDGTQALVAGVAAESGLAFLVISAGTRNHFAMGLGLDRTDPSRCLDALRGGVELAVDLDRDRRPPVRQQRLLRGLRRGGPQPRVPRRQDRNRALAAPGPADRTCRLATRRGDRGRHRARTPGGAGEQQPVREQ